MKKSVILFLLVFIFGCSTDRSFLERNKTDIFNENLDDSSLTAERLQKNWKNLENFEFNFFKKKDLNAQVFDKDFCGSYEFNFNGNCGVLVFMHKNDKLLGEISGANFQQKYPLSKIKLKYPRISFKIDQNKTFKNFIFFGEYSQDKQKISGVAYFEGMLTDWSANKISN